jgi:tRNA pseudouridine32 synthase/23S rRNA pseudouridine746 synthase
VCQEFHLTINTESPNLVDVISCASGLAKGQVKSAIQKGALWHTKGKRTQRLRRLDKNLSLGEQLHFYYNPKVLDTVVAPAQLIADEQSYSLWYKPYGMLCQGSKWSDHCTINRFAEQHLKPQRPAFIVHRLDRAASGLILIAHSKKTAALLAAQFEQRQIKKRYRIIVAGDQRALAQPQTVNIPLDDRPAVSHFRFLEYNTVAQRSLMEVDIETGRKHQIRRHAAAMKMPVVGDRLYGNDPADDDLQLRSCFLQIHHPQDNSLRSYSLPEELLLKFN